MPEQDAIIVGGGLAGLTAAALLGRAGRSVTLLEAGALGGRAKSSESDGYRFNLGPHALYVQGTSLAVLRELGVPISGGPPATGNTAALYRGRRYLLPRSPETILKTTLLGPRAKLEAVRLLLFIRNGDASPLRSVPVRDWLRREARSPEVRDLLTALIRLSTYSADIDRLSAGAAIEQVRLGTYGVHYQDGGWQTFVDGLACIAKESGAELLTGVPVAAVAPAEGGWTVRTSDGRNWATPSVILAVPPGVAARLVRGPAVETLSAWADRLISVTAASLDVAVSRLPDPQTRFGLGIDRALYFSVHCPPALLAPDGGVVLHATRYLGGGSDPTSEAVEAELEGVLDQLQPGWREVLVRKRFLREMVVTHALVTAEGGGLIGRPGPGVSGAAGLYVAGDWVGPEGMLTDAAIASAGAAVFAIADETRSPSR
jgi:phytoene dehydrogenase-like protein